MKTFSNLLFKFNAKMLGMKDSYVFQYQSKSGYHSVEENYQRAINALNRLQSNKQVLADASSCQFAESKIATVRSYFVKCGLDIETVEKKLSIIHVSGTKGKGSTCAYCESILRQYGYKTGFYSSPHLVSVRETIRINGQPITRQKFGDYFWELYRKLCSHDTYKDAPKMPPYFTFLTIMAFKIFIEEKVDVAIIEVGIGGEYDCTNILKNTPLVGISTIGYDHVKLLGNTIEEIAWQKAGIMKPNCIAITMSNQPPAATKILREKAAERNCTLFIAANMEAYFAMNKIPLGISSAVQPLNASLGAQLANAWLNPQYYKKESIMSFAPIFPLTNEIRLGVINCRWPGRTQILRYNSNLTFYLDGAHNLESIGNCVQWYLENVTKKSKKALVFNMTGDRDIDILMTHLIQCQFDYVFFCPNIVDADKTSNLEYVSHDENRQEELERSKQYYLEWTRKNSFQESKILLFNNVNEVIEYQNTSLKDENLHVLITGSLHLVGAFLTLLDPDLNQFTCTS